jgi:hypothetical protein
MRWRKAEHFLGQTHDFGGGDNRQLHEADKE